MTHHASKVPGGRLILVLLVALVVMAVINVAILTSASAAAGQKAAEKKAAAEPAKIEIIEIFMPDCAGCSGTSQSVAEIKKQNVNASQRRIDASSPEGVSLVSRHEISRLPALVVTGEVNKTDQLSRFWTQLGTVQDGAALIEPQLPYYSVRDGKVLGLVSLVRIIDSSCTGCSSIDVIVGSFERAGVVFSSDRTVEYDSSEGKGLIKTYGVREIPAAIISKDVLDYQSIALIWPQLNATEKNGSYALHVLQPPYRDLAVNKIIGLVDTIYINDSTCGNCYDVLLHQQILGENFGVVFANETFVDVNSAAGASLISRYSITKVPTFVVSPDAKYYTGLMQVWPSVGDEVGGWYVFRNMTAIGGTYRDLTTGKVVVPLS